MQFITRTFNKIFISVNLSIDQFTFNCDVIAKRLHLSGASFAEINSAVYFIDTWLEMKRLQCHFRRSRIMSDSFKVCLDKKLFRMTQQTQRSSLQLTKRDPN